MNPSPPHSPFPNCPLPERTDDLLHGRLSDLEQQQLESHLDSCAACQQRLEHSVADQVVWNETSRLLADDPWRKSISGHDDARESSSMNIQQVLQSLHPTDDPAMLGRLGGYEISGVVGSGGMGIVLKAIDRSLERTVAIKVLAPHLACSGAARRRFEREAKAAAAVLHPNVIAIHGVSNDSALPYLVMPYLRGLSLQRRIDDEGALPTIDILRIGTQVASGLAAAHQQGLVHRDIKPANVMLEDGVERVTITDFGLARAVDDASMTKTGVIAGTPQYMSPEQARGDAVDHRSDLFSLGSVLYALCSGRLPFRAETTFGILRRITDSPTRAIRELNPEIPVWLCCIIDRLHAKAPPDRFSSAEEVAELLAGCLAHWQSPTAVPLPEVAQQMLLKQTQTKPRPSKAKLLLISAATLVLSIFCGFTMNQILYSPLAFNTAVTQVTPRPVIYENQNSNSLMGGEEYAPIISADPYGSANRPPFRTPIQLTDRMREADSNLSRRMVTRVLDGSYWDDHLSKKIHATRAQAKRIKLELDD